MTITLQHRAGKWEAHCNLMAGYGRGDTAELACTQLFRLADSYPSVRKAIGKVQA